jgi:hypothetical protein
MKKLRLFAAFVLILVLSAQVSGASAQSNYSFNLASEIVHIFWNNDGTIALDYVLTFANDPGAHVIDFVDMGMPNGNYDWGSISADSNGNALSISSDFQGDGPYGFAVDMGGYAIQPGQTGTVHVYVGRISNMYYPNTDQPDTHASGEFAPAYWTTAHGSTNMIVIFHLPPGVQSNESIYYPASGGWPCDANPQSEIDNEGRILFNWTCPTASGDRQYTFGMSIPKQYIPADAIVVAPAFDFSGLLSTIFANLSTICCFGFFGLMFVGVPILSAVNQRKRKLQYMPPKISIEGHGIKRGLTAVESAVLMETPLDKVMTMILFGVVKKNAASVVTREPLKLQVAQTLPEGLHEYEKDFVAAFADPNKLPKAGLQEMTVKLIKAVSDKMKGFSRKETVDYYKGIMERAWQQIEAAGTPEIKSEMYEQAMEWTMLDKNYEDRTRRTFTGPVYVPMWWGNYDPSYRPTSTISSGKTAAPTISSVPSSGRSSVSVPGSAFAASVVNSVQGFSSRALGDVKTFTSGVTNRTNPVPQATASSRSSSGGGGGGRSCACACACAGCACACAGGGR